MQIQHSGGFYSISALVDSGATGNLIDSALAQKPQLCLQSIQHPLKLQALDGGPIEGGLVTQGTKPLTLHVSTLHKETISLLVTITNSGIGVFLDASPGKDIKSHTVMQILFTCPLFRWPQVPLEVQKPQIPFSYHRSTKSIRRYSVKPRIVVSLFVAPMTVQLNCWLELQSRTTVSIAYLLRTHRLWNITLRRPSNRGTAAPSRHKSDKSNSSVRSLGLLRSTHLTSSEARGRLQSTSARRPA